jgi:hypothetical protein
MSAGTHLIGIASDFFTRTLLLIGLLFIGLLAIFIFTAHWTLLGNLPGDIRMWTGGGHLYIPATTAVLLSGGFLILINSFLSN